MLLKTCFACGAKVKDLYESKCEECYKLSFPPIKELKPMTFKICNHTKRIWYNNVYHEPAYVQEMLPNWTKKNLILNDRYTLKKLDIENFEIKGHKLVFDVTVDCTLRKK